MMILGYDSEKMSCILHEFDAKHASAYIDFWFHKGREHLSPWREFRVCLIHRQLPHSSRDIAHLFFFFYVRRISVSPAGKHFQISNVLPKYDWRDWADASLFVLFAWVCAWCVLVRDYTCPVTLWWSPARPVSLEDIMLLMFSWHTHIEKKAHTHTQTYIKFLDTEGGTVCFMPVPEVVGGHQLTATVIDLSPWVEYEFRVLASNTIGTGEPSKPSKQARTKGTCMYRMSRKNVLSPLLKMYSMFVSSPLAWRMSLTSSFLQRNGNNGWVQAWRCIFLPRFSWEDWYYCHVC